MTGGIECCDHVSDAVNANDHSNALPKFGIPGLIHGHQFEHGEWEHDRIKPETEIVDSGSKQHPLHPSRGTWVHPITVPNQKPGKIIIRLAILWR